ncbi:MAG: hypothetical protein KGH78_03815 [Candidatus Micrarchaeota archaeon]|nr:hypothetical protein [Candidatus Micrarchaeota archaeon]
MKVYIMGPKQLATKGTIPFYENIVKFTKNYFKTVVCTYPDFWGSNKTPQQHYRFLKRVIRSCDWLIAEASTPATGLGVQLEMAVAYKIPVIALVKEGQKASTLVLGLPVLRETIVYKSQKDLNLKLAKAFAAI